MSGPQHARGVARTLPALAGAGVLAVAAACGGSGRGTPALHGELSLPPFPFAPADGLALDEGRLASAADAHCTERRGDGSSVLFFLEDLPFAAVDSLCAAPTTCPACDAAMGELYLSGYFGGLWLRDAVQDLGAAASVLGTGALATDTWSPRETATALPTTPPGGFDGAVIRSLAASADRAIALAATVEPDALVADVRSGLPFLLALVGYNRGYLESALDNPPPGVPAPDPLACEGLLGCTREGRDLAVLDRSREALAQLDAPPSAAWEEAASLVERWGESSIASGREVWDSILADSFIDARAYEPLIEVSAGYLLVSEAAVLSGMVGWADADLDQARCGALVRAALVVWSGSYFTGLASDAPVGTFPELACVPR